MRQRLTFLVPEGTFIDVQDIKVDDQVFNFTASPGFAGAERRTTLGLSELPKAVRFLVHDARQH